MNWRWSAWRRSARGRPSRKVKSKGVELEVKLLHDVERVADGRKVKSKGVELEGAGEPSRCEFDER